MKHEIKLFVNDIPYNITVNSQDTLLYALRDILHLTGTKKGCGEGECGACTVIMDGEAVRSCLILAVEADGKKIITIEGVSANGKLSRVQRAFVEAGAIQCGFCTPGFVMAIEAALRKKKTKKEELIKAVSGHLCRCTGYENIIKAIDKIVRG
ncbi:MAG: (2Fe-2S)-binding protein [Elusimicrobia bacterium]|nr:(2Fe-2S)-binding protein [Elusimicrobiota bacterium]